MKPLLLLPLPPALAEPGPRFCGGPVRGPSGEIYRSTAQKAAFVRMHPCPVNGQTTGSCPGWQVDHVIPLACGGCDQPVNMQWLPVEIKTCKDSKCKDRWERTVYQTTVRCQ